MSWHFLMLHESGRQGKVQVSERPLMLEIRNFESLDSMLRPLAVFGTTAFAFPSHAAAPHAFRSARRAGSISCSSFREGIPMATAADWEDRFNRLVRLSPGDGNGIWALIVECMGDDASLTRTFNAALRRHAVPHASWVEMRQALALRLVNCIQARPHLNLHHRWPSVTAAAWFHAVINKLCDAEMRARRTRHRRHLSLDELLVKAQSARSEDDDIEMRHGTVEHSCENQGACQIAADTAQDLAQALGKCDRTTISVIVAYAKDHHVQTVADELKVSYATAWRKVKQAQKLLRQLLPGYGDDRSCQTKRSSCDHQ